MKIEVWRDVIGYEGYYQVSNQGRVRSLDRWVVYKDGRKRLYKGRFFDDNLNVHGYKQVTLSRDGKQEYFLTHQLVAVCFLNHEPNGHTLVVDHINGIRTDNRVENLRIVTHRENISTCHRKDRNTLTSDLAGVSYHKPTKKWQARLTLNGRQIYLGIYPTEEEAYQAILEFEAIQPILV